jgi:chorismate mutase/prephenate dehydratase
MIKEKSLKNAAAIASERAANIYGMHTLAKDIADNPENYTRFFVLSTQDSPPTGKDKTSIIFSAKHEPGSLYNALGEFAKRNINLTKIESRPTKKTPWEYNFYLDFEGHRTEPNCTEALKALEKYAIFVKVLGSYPKA